jgi:DNA methyltransferase 1-associated protein 1
MAPFTNSARSDGLVLRHWQRQHDPVNVPAPEPSEMETEEKREEEAPKPAEPEYAFAKYNVKARIPRRYTDEEYTQRLRSDDWSRQETDYLMDLVEEYDLRWVVIADRYDYQAEDVDSEANATALVPAKRYRTMEQMKARYYSIAATMLAIEHPPSEMSETEFELHEKMLKFDADRERSRKELAALQLNRTSDEVREEGILLEELKRITANEQNFVADRRELYSRLEVPVSVGNTTMYQSSQGLSQLLQTLLQADKTKKRRSILGPDGGIPSPAGAQGPGGPGGQPLPSRADTPTAYPPGAPATNKKSAAAAAAGREAQQTLKQLTPAEEAKYGVQHHERLTPSVQFRSDRAQKLTQAKSNVQTQKLAAALAELEIPLRLVMPTERVCKDFEKLIHQVNLLLDARKVAEKVESEIRVLEAAREERVRRETGDTGAGAHSGPGPGTDATATGAVLENQGADVKVEADESQGPVSSAPPADPTIDAPAAGFTVETQAGSDEKEKERDAAAENEQVAAAAASHKRSASVLSNGSDKSTKRQRK